MSGRLRTPALIHPANDVTSFELSRLGAVLPADLLRDQQQLRRSAGGVPVGDPPVIDGVISDGTALDQVLAVLNERGIIRHQATRGDYGEPLSEVAPFDQYRVMQILANGGAATLSAVGTPTPTFDGTLTADDDSGGPWVRFATGAAVANVGISSALAILWGAWEPTLVTKLRIGPDITNVRIWVALTSVNVDGSSSPASAHLAGFRFDSGSDQNGGVNTWRICTKDGTTQATTFGDDPTPINASDIVTLQIALRTGHALFTINDAPVADVTGNLPSTSQPLGVQIRLRSLTAANKFIRVDRVAILHR